MGGLALLAQHLPTIYPDTIRSTPNHKIASEQCDSDWIKVEGRFYSVPQIKLNIINNILIT